MGKPFLRISAAGAALTANALRPIPSSNPLAIPSFFASWLASEAAIHNLAITVTGATSYVARKRAKHQALTRSDKVALALNGATAVGLAALIRQGMQVQGVIERALAEGLGDEWAARLDPAPTKADLTTPWRQVLRPWEIRHPDVRITRDIQYADPIPGAKSRRNLLDVYQPRESGTKRPVLLQIHGGGWVIGDKEQQGLPLMNHLAARGWVCVAPNYPLAPKSTWPDHIVACKQALAWIKENIEEYGGDPDFVCVTGESAGGHLAAMVGLTPNDPEYQPGFEHADTSVAACVPFYGAYDMANVLGTKAAEREYKMFLSPWLFKTKDRDVARRASPLTRVHADAPPFFLLHGTYDSLINVTEARELARRLRETSTSTVIYAELPGAQHAFDIFASIRGAHAIRGVERFLRDVYSDYQTRTQAASSRSA
ncbi:MAG: alpha/beta hydrolase [Frankiaceae bacterium]|nr:alpha/beta hydrolase [Frankiaceae bacterium]